MDIKTTKKESIRTMKKGTIKPIRNLSNETERNQNKDCTETPIVDLGDSEFKFPKCTKGEYYLLNGLYASITRWCQKYRYWEHKISIYAILIIALSGLFVSWNPQLLIILLAVVIMMNIPEDKDFSKLQRLRIVSDILCKGYLDELGGTALAYYINRAKRELSEKQLKEYNDYIDSFSFKEEPKETEIENEEEEADVVAMTPESPNEDKVE